jgi:hypothetical protein
MLSPVRDRPTAQAASGSGLLSLMADRCVPCPNLHGSCCSHSRAQDCSAKESLTSFLHVQEVHPPLVEARPTTRQSNVHIQQANKELGKRLAPPAALPTW